jgi:hypothetical protein
MPRAVVALVLMALAGAAQAYCVQNQLSSRSVRVEQEAHPDKLRGERTFRHTLAPGERQCCHFKNLDCNPLGRRDAIVSLSVTIPGNPEYHCGYPEGAEPNVKVTGGGHVRIQENPRRRSAAPYIVRVRTHDKDITGPRGLACPALSTKGKP